MAFRCISRSSTVNRYVSLIPKRDISFAQIGTKLDGVKGTMTGMMVKYNGELKTFREKFKPAEQNNGIDFTYHSRLLDDYIKKNAIDLNILQEVNLKQIKESERNYNIYFSSNKNYEKRAKLCATLFVGGMTYACMKTGMANNYNAMGNVVTGIMSAYYGMNWIESADSIGTEINNIDNKFNSLCMGLNINKSNKSSKIEQFDK